MPKHEKPTKEDIQKKINDALDAKPVVDPEPAPIAPPADPEPSQPAPSEPAPSEPIPSQPPADPEPSQPAPDPKPSPDYKEKFKQSTTEAQILTARNRAVNEAMEKANNLPEPTEEDLVKENPDWDMMTEFERKTAKETFINKRFREAIGEATKQFIDFDKWRQSVEDFIDNPKIVKDYPELNGKEEQFREFCLKPTRKGVPFEDLVSSFFYNLSLKPKTPNKGKMFETGNGGAKEVVKPKNDHLTLAQGAILKQTDYKKYKEFLIAGKIDSE